MKLTSPAVQPRLDGEGTYAALHDLPHGSRGEGYSEKDLSPLRGVRKVKSGYDGEWLVSELSRGADAR